MLNYIFLLYIKNDNIKRFREKNSNGVEHRERDSWLSTISPFNNFISSKYRIINVQMFFVHSAKSARKLQHRPTIVIHNSLRDSIISRTMVREYFSQILLTTISHTQKKIYIYIYIILTAVHFTERRKDIESAKQRLITMLRSHKRNSLMHNFRIE